MGFARRPMPNGALIYEGAYISNSTQITPRNPHVVDVEDADLNVPSLSLRDFVQVLRRRKMIALITFFSIVALVAVTTLLTKPQYLSSASVLLEDQANQAAVSDLSAIFAPQAGMAVESQVQLLNSPLIINQVYQESHIPPGEVKATISRDGVSSKIDIVGVSTNKDYAHNFVAAVPKVYQDNRRKESAREVTSELEFARKDLAKEEAQLNQIEANIADFKNRNGLLDPSAEATNALNSAAKSKSDLAAARTDISSTRAQIAALQGDLDKLPGSVNSPVTTTNPKIAQLQSDLADLKSERAKQLFLYKPNDDTIVQIDRQIKTLQDRIARTAPTVTNNSLATNPAVEALRDRIASTRADLSAKEAAAVVLAAQSAKLNKALGRYTDIQRQQAQLQRDLDALQGAVKDGNEKVRQLSARERAMQVAGAPITILEPGTPAVKIAPNPVRNLILALFVGALLACGAALLQDSLDDRVRDEDEARQILGAPILAHFPLLPVSDERQILDLNKPDRLLLETFRALRSNVQFALVNSAGKKLQVTSTVPNEGKSYIASNLAITMALDGRKVILVDADLHRPTAHERFNVARQPGLTNVLVGQSPVRESLQESGFDNLLLLSAGALPPNPAELLNSPAMADVMQELESMADLVIFDTPPLLATSDSQLMSAKMDGVVFVMQMGSVARSGTLRAFELLKQAHANVIGIVFNKVDAGKDSSAYGGYSGHYALDAVVSEEDVLVVNPIEDSVKPLMSGNGASANGTSTNGSSKNGSATNGSHGQATVFDEAIAPDENSR